MSFGNTLTAILGKEFYLLSSDLVSGVSGLEDLGNWSFFAAIYPLIGVVMRMGDKERNCGNDEIKRSLQGD
jgi:hypothetical protein